MSNFSTITNSKDYVNYVFNIGTRGVLETTTEIVGMSHTIQNLLGNLAFKTSEYLTSTETLAMGFGIAATAAFAHATQSAIEFQQATASVEAISGKNLIGSEIGAKAMALSNEFGLAIGEMTQGLEALARAGIVANSSIDALMRAGVQMSKFEGTDLEESINSILSTTNLLNPDANPDSEEYAQIVADLNQRIISTSESAPLNAKNIMDTLQHVGGYASATGIDQADLFATIAQLGAKGTKGDIAGTSLRAFISAGQKDTGQRALARIGLDVSDLWNDDGTAMLPISEVKRILDEALVSAGFSAQERLEFYSDFAGYKQANQIMKIDSTEVDEYRAKIDNAMTLTDKMNIILGTVQGNWAQIWNTVSNYMTKVGSTLLPIINAILIPIKYIVKAIDAIPFSNVIGAFALGSIAVRGISTAFNALVPTISSFILKFSDMDTKGFTLKGYFEDITKSLSQSKDILMHINDKEYMKKIMEERDTASTDKELTRRLEREAIDAYYRQQYGRLTDENGELVTDSMGREIWRWDTLSASERAYIANAHTPDNDDIEKIISARKRTYESTYSQVIRVAQERGGFEAPPQGWADQTRFFEQRGKTFEDVIAKAVQEISENIDKLTQQVTGARVVYNESNRERNQRKSDHEEVIYNESNRERNRRRSDHREVKYNESNRERNRRRQFNANSDDSTIIDGRKHNSSGFITKAHTPHIDNKIYEENFTTSLGKGQADKYRSNINNKVPGVAIGTDLYYHGRDSPYTYNSGAYPYFTVPTGVNSVEQYKQILHNISEHATMGENLNVTNRFLQALLDMGFEIKEDETGVFKFYHQAVTANNNGRRRMVAKSHYNSSKSKTYFSYDDERLIQDAIGREKRELAEMLISRVQQATEFMYGNTGKTYMGYSLAGLDSPVGIINILGRSLRLDTGLSEERLEKKIQSAYAEMVDTTFHELTHAVFHADLRTENRRDYSSYEGKYDKTGFFKPDQVFANWRDYSNGYGSYTKSNIGYELESNYIGNIVTQMFGIGSKGTVAHTQVAKYADLLDSWASQKGTDIDIDAMRMFINEINDNPLYFFNMMLPMLEELNVDSMMAHYKPSNSLGGKLARASDTEKEKIEDALTSLKNKFWDTHNNIKEGLVVQEYLTNEMDSFAEEVFEIINDGTLSMEEIEEIIKGAENRANRTVHEINPSLNAFRAKNIAETFDEFKQNNQDNTSFGYYKTLLSQEFKDRKDRYATAMTGFLVSPIIDDEERLALKALYEDFVENEKDAWVQNYISTHSSLNTLSTFEEQKEELIRYHSAQLEHANKGIKDDAMKLVNAYIQMRAGNMDKAYATLTSSNNPLVTEYFKTMVEQYVPLDANGDRAYTAMGFTDDGKPIPANSMRYYKNGAFVRDIGGNILKNDEGKNRKQDYWNIGGFKMTAEQLKDFRKWLQPSYGGDLQSDKSNILSWFASLDPEEWYGAFLTLNNRQQARVRDVFFKYFQSVKKFTDTGIDNFEYDFINPQEYELLFKHLNIPASGALLANYDVSKFDNLKNELNFVRDIYNKKKNKELTDDEVKQALEDRKETLRGSEFYRLYTPYDLNQTLLDLFKQGNNTMASDLMDLGVRMPFNDLAKEADVLDYITWFTGTKDNIVEMFDKYQERGVVFSKKTRDLIQRIRDDEDALDKTGEMRDKYGNEAEKLIKSAKRKQLKMAVNDDFTEIPYKDLKFNGFVFMKKWLENEEQGIDKLAETLSYLRDNKVISTISTQDKWLAGEKTDWTDYLFGQQQEYEVNGIKKSLLAGTGIDYEWVKEIDKKTGEEKWKVKWSNIKAGNGGLQFYYNMREAIMKSYGLDPSDIDNPMVRALDTYIEEANEGFFKNGFAEANSIKKASIENFLKSVMVDLDNMPLNRSEFVDALKAQMQSLEEAQAIIALGLQAIPANLRDQYLALQRNMQIEDFINRTKGASAGRSHQRMIVGGYGAEARQAEDELFEAQQIRIGAQRYADMYGQNTVENKAQQEALKNLRRQHENLRSVQADIMSMGRNASESQIPMAILDMEKNDWIANEAQRIFDSAQQAGHAISMEDATAKAEKNWEKGKNSGFGLEQREKRQNLAKQFAGLDTHGINPTYFADMVRMQQGTYDAEDSAIAPWKKTIENINAFMGSVGGFGLPNGSSLFADLVTEAGMNGGKLMMDEEGNFNEYVEDTLKQAEDLRDWTTLWTIAPEIKEREMDKLDGIFTTWKRDKLIDVFGTAERVQRMSDEEISKHWQNNWVDDLYEWRAQATERASNKMAEMLTQFNEDHNMEEGVEQFKQYMGSIGMVFANASERVGMLHGAMAELSNVFPVLTPLVWGLGTVYSILTGITTALAVATTFLTEAQNEELKSKLTQAFSKVLEPLKKTIAGTLGKAMSSIAGFVGSLSLTTVAIIGGVVASILAVVFALKKSAESHDAYVKELTEKQDLLNKESQGAYISYEQNKRLIRRGARDDQQQSYREAMYNLSKTKLESANLKRMTNAFKLAEQNSDALWGEYGARTKLQAESWGEALATGGPIGLIAKYFAGEFESKYQEHLGYTGGIRQIREETLKRDFFHTTDAMRQASAYYDANQVAFNTLEQYKTELSELYDLESKYVKRTGDVESARQNQRFQKALLETTEKTGLTQEQILSYLNWLQIEKNVDTATQAMQATADQIVANAEKQAFAIEFGQDMDDVLGLNGVEAQQKAMIQAQADMIKMEAEDKLWWKAFWAELSAVFWAVMSPLTTLVNFLQYIYLGVNYIAQILAHGWWSDEAEQAGNALDKKGKDLQSSMGDLFGVGRAGRKARVYRGAFDEMVNADLYSVGESAVSPYDRNNFGTDASSTGTMSSSGVSSRYRSSMGNATQMTSKRNTDEVFANRLREEQRAGIFDIFDLLKHWKDNPQGSGGNLLGDVFGFILGLTPVGPALDIANSLGSIFSSEEDRQKAKDALKATKEAVDKVQAGEKGAVIIKNININTDDDPEKIKTALMNMIIELQEQIQPRTVSRTVGEQSNSNNADNGNNTPDQSGNTNPTN